MSWGTCYSGSNNIHFDFPPIMSDGRNFASWQPGAEINKSIRKENNILSNSQYRSYLVHNADQIIKMNQQEACNDCGCCNIMQSQRTTNSPYVYQSCVQNNMPFGYEDSDLKNVYLTSQQLQCRMTAPILTQDQYLMQQYPNPN
jgi:hypothetical protein